MKFSLKNISIRFKFSVIIALTLVASLGALYFIANYFENKTLDFEIAQSLAEAQESFGTLIYQDEKMLRATTESFLQNEEYKKIFSERDREKLYQATRPLFENLRDKYGITHLYFHLPDGQNFLRVHQKDLFGDAITRATFTQASNSGNSSSGIELGKTAFALRVVYPYYYEGKLIGYVEFGEEINHILDILAKETGDKYIYLGDSRFINRADWERIQEAKKGNFKWDDVVDHVVLGTSGDIGQKEKDFLTHEFVENVEQARTFSSAEKIKEGSESLIPGGFLILGADKNPIGMVVSFHKITDILALIDRFKKNLAYALILLAIIAFAAADFFSFKHIIKPINKIKALAERIIGGDFNQKAEIDAGDELGRLSLAFNSMAEAVKRAFNEVDAKVKDQTKELNDKIAELENFQKLTLEREIKMVELKKEIEDLKNKSQPK